MMEKEADWGKQLSGPHSYLNSRATHPPHTPAAHSLNSHVFSLVVDPRTDFQVPEGSSSEDIASPQQSYNLTPPLPPLDHPAGEKWYSESQLSPPLSSQHSDSSSLPPSPSQHTRRILYGIIDSHLWSSDGSLASGGRGSGGGGVGGEGSVPCSRGCGGGAGGSGHPRLVVAGVHRFGSRLPCAGSPHDLASCPAPAPPPQDQRAQAGKPPSSQSLDAPDRSDALKTLREASTALALTETLIGPLKIPPVPQEVLSKVVSSMERKAKAPTNVMANGRHSSQQHLSTEATARATSRGEVAGQHSGSTEDLVRNVGSLSSVVLQPGVHQKPPIAREQFKLGMDGNNLGSGVQKEQREPKPEEQDHLSPPMRDDSMSSKSRSRVVSVPVGMSEQGPVEVYRELHQYPPATLTTVVERKSYIGLSQPSPEVPRHRKHSHRLRKGNDRASKSSLLSEASTQASTSTMASHGTSLGPSKASSRGSLNGECVGPLSRPLLASTIHQMKQALETTSTASDIHSNRSSGGLDAASTFSDTSSNLSNLSDLSGYEDEYMRIKRLVSDAILPPEDHRRMMGRLHRPPSPAKQSPAVDYEKVIREAQAQKEDLEIQLHRLSIQVQNAVREKELYQQQLELMQTKVTETNQKQYFEVLKQRANLEGQLEMLKQELEDSVYERTRLQTKLSQALKDSDTHMSSADSARESEAQMKARLVKFEEANKGLEAELEEVRERLERAQRDQEKAQREARDLLHKSQQQELSLLQHEEHRTKLLEELTELRSHTSQLQTECKTLAETQAQTESAVSKASSELLTAQSSSVWYQKQLQAAQEARTTLQQDLLDARTSLAKTTSEREMLEARVQALVQEAEEGRARAVREKTLLVSHLEALQADMAEREALLAQLEQDKNSNGQLREDRQQKLEQDRQRIHQLRLDLADGERQLEFTREDLRQKTVLLARHEAELKELRKADAVGREVMREKDQRIQTLETDLKELTFTVQDQQEQTRAKDSQIASLEEEKVKLEVSLVAAGEEKKEVDEAILKVREDMTRLTSNFYRMKHDLAARERLADHLTSQMEEANQLRAASEKRLAALQERANQNEENTQLRQQVQDLKVASAGLTGEKEKLESELEDLRRTHKTLAIERKGLAEAVQLREEQIQNMQNSAESYREAILKKDEELYVAQEQNAALDKTCLELRRSWEALKADNLTLRQDTEAFAEHERTQRKEVAELKESIQKERKLKQSLERKVEDLAQERESDRAQVARERERCEELSLQVELFKKEAGRHKESLTEAERKSAELSKELQAASGEKSGLEGRLQEAVQELDCSQASLRSERKAIQSLEAKLEAASQETRGTRREMETLQQETERQVADLKTVLKAKSQEVAKLQQVQSEREAAVTKLREERDALSAQVSAALAENTHLKKSARTTELLVSESARPDTNNVKKPTKSLDGMHSEVSVLIKKLSECEIKLNEANKQRESLRAAVKSTKKDNFLMKAKLKDLEKLKKRCTELEMSSQGKENLEDLTARCCELQTRLEEGTKEKASLSAALNEKEASVQLLLQREQELTAELTSVHANQRELQDKVMSLETTVQTAQEDLACHQQRLKTSEGERNAWMAKYESLRDSIPERDTSTQPAVQLAPATQHQSFSTSREPVIVSNTSSNANGLVESPTNNFQFLSEVPQTIADLQEQVSVTSEALQSKEEEIHSLQHQLKTLREEGAVSGTPHTCTEDLVSGTVHNQQINELLQRIQNLKVASASCYRCEEHKEEAARGREESQSLLEKIGLLEGQVNEKEEELQEAREKATTTANEFREKQRRYESNVRLLTRKLKEHMKGRKAAEREKQTQVDDHQRVMAEERQRYDTLRARCLELEGQREGLEGQVAGLESEVGEVRAALGRSQQDTFTHHTTILHLQKDIGRLQEICKAMDGLRAEVSSLQGKLEERERRVSDLERDLGAAREEGKEREKRCASLVSTVEELKGQVEQQQKEHKDTATHLEAARQRLKTQEEEHQKVEESVRQLEEANSDLKQRLSAAGAQCDQLAHNLKQLGEERQMEADTHKSTKGQLQDSFARITALESQIKVLEGELNVSCGEVSQVREQLTAKETSHQWKVTQLEQSLEVARKEVAAITEKLGQTQHERVNYQSQATQLRAALHSTLAQLKAHESEKEARVAKACSLSSEVEVIPSPKPLDVAAFTQLIERSSLPVRPSLPLTNLESCLSSLKAEVNMLQTQLQNTKPKEPTLGLTPETDRVLVETASLTSEVNENRGETSPT